MRRFGPWCCGGEFAVTDTGSVAVVAVAIASPFASPREGEIGVGAGCSEMTLLIEPALELAALGGAVDRLAAP